MSEIIDAAIAGDAALVRQLLAADASLANGRDTFIGSTPLIFASHRGHAAVVEALLAAGADPNARESVSGATALHWAADGGHAGVIEALLNAGAGLTARDAWYDLGPVGWTSVVSWTPEFHHDRPAAARLLLAKGARLDPFSAIACGDMDGLRGLGRFIVTERLGFAGRGAMPLHFAVSRGAAEAAGWLIEMGADPNALTEWGVSALALAKPESLASALRRAGAVPDLSCAILRGDWAEARSLPFKAGYLLHAAAEAGLTEAVSILVERGMDVDGRARVILGERANEVTPLHLAARAGSAESAMALIQRGADVNARSEPSRQTPLHCAVVSGKLSVARVLLARGADTSAEDSDYCATPAGWAQQAGDESMRALLATPA